MTDGMKRPGRLLGDVGVRRVHRGEDHAVDENAEYSFVLPAVDKVAIIALGLIEFAAVVTESAAWDTQLHLLTIIAIAGLGGYSLMGRGTDSPPQESAASFDWRQQPNTIGYSRTTVPHRPREGDGQAPAEPPDTPDTADSEDR